MKLIIIQAVRPDYELEIMSGADEEPLERYGQTRATTHPNDIVTVVEA